MAEFIPDNGVPNTQKKTRKQQADLSNYAFGKVPPNARDLEEAVLGALMLERDAIIEVVDVLNEDAFYVDAHQKIYKAILKLFRDSKPVDLLTVTDQLRKNGELDVAGGPYYLVELTNRVASSANVEFHSRIIAEKFIQRELIKMSSNLIKKSYDETQDVFELLNNAGEDLYKITENNLNRSYEDITSLVNKAIKKLQDLKDSPEQLNGVPSGFLALDRVTSGWQPSDLIILAARPGMGKTAFTLNVARNAAVMYKKPVAFFSLEMSSLQLVNRLISSESEIEGEKLKKGNLEPHEWQQLNSKIEELSEAKIFIDDTPGLNVFELRAKCRRLKQQHDIQMIMIDYLQLMTAGNSKGGNREQEIAMISRSLKGIAKELNVPVIALSQLNRSVETRTGSKKPQLSDLRESGSIEQDADIVSFIYRPEYYDILEDEEGNSLAGIAEIIIAKHRNGALGSVPLKFIGHFAKFTDLDENDFGAVPLEDMTGGDKIITMSSRMNTNIDNADADDLF